MLNVREDATNTYVFTGVIPALASVIFTVAGNSIVIKEISKKIVTEAAHITLISAAAQARSSLIDLIAV
jgi:hypothetical protein